MDPGLLLECACVADMDDKRPNPYCEDCGGSGYVVFDQLSVTRWVAENQGVAGAEGLVPAIAPIVPEES